MAGRRRSDRALRGKLRSPGRPPVARQEHRRRFWAFIAEGLSSEDAAMEVGVSQPVGTRWFREAGGMAPSHLSALVEAALGAVPDVCRAGGDRAVAGAEVLACGRSPVARDGRHRRSRASCGATRRRGAATWITGQPPRSGMRSGRRAVRSGRSSRRMRRCGPMCGNGSPGPSSLRAALRCLGRPCPGRDADTGLGSTDAGRGRGARSRSPSACGSTSRMTRACASATRRSTRRFTCKAGVR